MFPMALVFSLMPSWLGAQAVLLPLRLDTPPVIDGDLGDAAWQRSPKVTGFKTWTPDFGIVMDDQTEVWYAYDSENLYFAFRCFDREPDKVKASMASRDNIEADDWVCINLDSFGDQQSLYAFYINPLGIQRDTRLAAGQEDAGFDAVWSSAGRIDQQGYTIEVGIPFKSLRYDRADLVKMGVVFERSVRRRARRDLLRRSTRSRLDLDRRCRSRSRTSSTTHCSRCCRM